MGRTCTVCRRADRDQLNVALAEGVSLRILSLRYGVSVSALFRHCRHAIKGDAPLWAWASLVRVKKRMQILQERLGP